MRKKFFDKIKCSADTASQAVGGRFLQNQMYYTRFIKFYQREPKYPPQSVFAMSCAGLASPSFLILTPLFTYSYLLKT